MTDRTASLSPEWPEGFFELVDSTVYALLEALQLFGAVTETVLDLPSRHAIDLMRVVGVGPVPQADLVGWLGLSAATISRAVHECTEAGLLRQDRDPDDRRAAVLALTPEGRDVIDAINELRTGTWNEIGEELGHDEVTRRFAEFKPLLDNLRDRHRATLARLRDAPLPPSHA